MASSVDLTGAEWEERLQWLLLRSRGLCEACGQPLGGFSRREVEIQHRRARGMGGSRAYDTNLLSNLLILHGPCHRAVEDRRGDEDLLRGLWIRHEYRDGVLIPAAEYPLQLWSGRWVLLDDGVDYRPHPDEWGVRALASRLRSSEAS